MKRLFIGLLLTAATCSHATAATTAREHTGWKIPQHFDMSVAGLQGTYQPGEQIVLQVEGMSKLLDAVPAAGFKVKAKLYDFPRTRSYTPATIVYDTAKHVWQVKLVAPDDKNKSYEIQVHLYCNSVDSPCAATYGRSAQVEKILPLQVK